jgi:FkbM family methyltransferase
VTPPFVLRQPLAPSGVIGKVARVARLALRIAPLGTTPLDRARLLAAPPAFLLAARLGRPLRMTLSLTAFGRSARCTVADYSHLLLLKAIFRDGDYAVEPRREPRTIVDLGSNVGLSILYFRLRFPHARIVGVEPDPVAFGVLQRNVGRLADVVVRHAAVGDREGTTTLWSAPGATASALERSHAAQEPVEVPLVSLERVLADAAIDGVDILKLVVEGSEFRTLRSLEDLRRLDAITGEVLFVDGDPNRSEDAFRALLSDFDVSLHEDKGDGFWQFHAYRRSAVTP